MLSSGQFFCTFLLVLGLANPIRTQPPADFPRELLRAIDEKEQFLIGLANYTEALFQQRKELIESCNCSKYSGSNDVFDVACVAYYGQHPDCDLPCRRVNRENSVFLVPPETHLDELSAELKQSICVYKHIEDYIKEHGEGEHLPAYVGEPGHFFASSDKLFFPPGTVDGHFRTYPGVPCMRGNAKDDDERSDCLPFELRTRPWFIRGSTGPKDIVLVLDVSGSMNRTAVTPTKWDLVNREAQKILTTLDVTDHVNVVLFDEDARTLWNASGLARATAENIKKIKAAVDEVSIEDKNTNFRAAFEAAFPLLWQDCGIESLSCSGCQKVILFLTDGRDTSAARNTSIRPSEMAERIEKLQKKLEKRTRKRASIFTYSMSREADDAIPRQIACVNDGTWSYVEPTSDTFDSLLSYYLYMAARVRAKSPFWLEPYEDAFGLGKITTVALPIYGRGTSMELDIFLGVVAHDVRLKELTQGHTTADDVLAELIWRSRYCGYWVDNPCELQVYRQAQDERALCVDVLAEQLPSNDSDEDPETGLCYKLGNDYYRRSLDEVSWKQAKSNCREQDGHLVSIGDEDELAFVVRVASLDGSWVGARRESEEAFSWLDRDLEELHDSSNYWGVQEPMSDGKTCAAIDPRGAIGNMHAKPCETKMSYICKFRSKTPCGERIRHIPKKGYFKMPHLGACTDIGKALKDTAPHSSVADLTNEDVVCPIGKPDVTNREILCCDTCSY